LFATATIATKQVKVAYGNILNAITGTASLGLAETADVVFETAGTVDKILVKESDSVTKGQLLATLDNSTLEDTIKTYQNNLSTAQRTFNDKQYSLVKTQRVIATKQMSEKQAELTLQTAQQALSDISDVKAVQDVVDDLNDKITWAQEARAAAAATNSTGTEKAWIDQINFYTQQLTSQQTKLANVLSGKDVSTTEMALQIAQAQFTIEQDQKAIADAKTAIQDAQVDVDNAQLDVNDAQLKVNDAQTKLDDAKALNTTVVAPFDGFITAVKVSGGDDIYKGTVAVQIADPNQFNASFQVSETDVFSVTVGQAAVVTVDANNLSFPAKVEAIAPLATTSSGVVTYKVTAELTSLVPISANSGPASARTATLKQGLSASVSITIQEKKNVLIVPVRAVTTAGGKSTVQVVNGASTETVEIQTGLSDNTNIEIVTGLREGQIVTVKASGSSSSNSSFGPGGGGMMIQ
jgi:HlyD family secretion protein